MENSDFIRQLSAKHGSRDVSSQIRRDLIKNATTDQLLAIVECCYNIIRSRVPLSKTQRQKLAAQAHDIRAMSRVKTASGARKILIRSEKRSSIGNKLRNSKKQKGGGFPIALASLITSVVAPLLTQIFR